MQSQQADVLRHVVSQLAEMASPENRAAAQALQDLAFKVFLEPREARPRGRQSAGLTITVGNYGYVVYDKPADAALALGLSANTLNVRLSQSKGRYILSRQDPETHEQMSVIVERGKLAATNERAKEMLEATPARNKPAKSEKLAPIEHDEKGLVKTNRLRRFNPVENS